VSPGECHQGAWAVAFVLCREAEGLGVVQPRQEAVEHLTAVPHTYRDGDRLFIVVCGGRMKGNGHKFNEGILDWL